LGVPIIILIFYLLSGDSFEMIVKLDLPPPFDIQRGNDNTIIRILGSAVNDTICIYDFDNHSKIVLWNPATNEIKAIPPSLGEVSPEFIIEFDLHGFGYDHISGDYKVVQQVCYFSFGEYVCPWITWVDVTPMSFLEIYSLKSNSWKKLNFDMPARYTGTDIEVYLNGVCYWIGKAIGVTNVVSFYLSNEVVFITPLPLEDDDFDVNLVVLNRNVAIIINYEENTSFQISILGELGVKESWIRLFNIKPFSCIEQPIGAGKKGNVFFIKEDGELACFDLTTGMIKEIGFKGEKYWCQVVIYKENLHPIGGINK
jgi:F-box interacting protein